MTTTSPRRRGGFTLVELMVALVVSGIVIAGALALMVSQQRTYRDTAGDRYLQEMARIALGHLVGNLRQAGFGVDPSLAFDLGPMNGVRMDRAFASQTFSTTSTPMGDGTACNALCRDSTVGPDEIVFFSRDPSFGPHPLTVGANAASASLVVASAVPMTIQAGQVLQVVCYSGAMTWAYVQARGPATNNGDGTWNIPIAASGAATFPTQNPWLDDACFGSVATMVGGVVSLASLQGATEVFKVDRYHYFIRSYDLAGNVQPWGTPNTRPYLMLDRGLSNQAGPAVEVVAPDVEDLQLSYVFPNDAAAPLVGAAAGVGLTNDDAGVNLAPAAGGPAYSDATSSASRANHHPGNIGAVRVGIVVRSTESDLTRTNAEASTVPASANRPGVAGAPGYFRLQVETTVSVPNLGAQAPYYPAYGAFPAASGSRDLNVGGG